MRQKRKTTHEKGPNTINHEKTKIEHVAIHTRKPGGNEKRTRSTMKKPRGFIELKSKKSGPKNVDREYENTANIFLVIHICWSTWQISFVSFETFFIPGPILKFAPQSPFAGKN